MKIAFLHHSFILGSGTDSLIYQYAKRLGKSNEVTVVTFYSEWPKLEDVVIGRNKAHRNPQPTENFWVNLQRIPYGSKRLGRSVFAPLFWNRRRLFEELNTHDVVITMLYPACLIPLWHRRKFKWVHVEWSTPEGVWHSLGGKSYAVIASFSQGMACRFADHVIFPSWFVNSWSTRTYGTPKSSTTMFFDGIDFSSLDKSKVDNRRDRKNILFVGRLVPHKNLETLIRAMPLVLKEVPGTTLTLVGSLSDTKYVGKLDRLSIDLGLRPNTVQFVGVAPWEKLPGYYANCTVFCSPSLWEGFLRPECYAFEKPMIALDRTSSREVIFEQRTGNLVWHNSPSEFASAITLALELPLTTERLGKNGYEWALSNLDLDKLSVDFEKVLKGI